MTSYLHGFSGRERERLLAQAAMLASRILTNLPWAPGSSVLDLGCGVGAMTRHLAAARPDLTLTAVDGSPTQVAAAQEHLAGLPQVQVAQADAYDLPFADRTYQGLFSTWLLEHLERPAQALSEALRVLRPGCWALFNEVQNSTFFLDPYSPSLWRYWTAFNEWQSTHGGDPWIGAKLGDLLARAGFVEVEVEPRLWLLDSRRPDERREKMLFWQDLMASAAPVLLRDGAVDEDLVAGMMADWEAALDNAEAVFFAGFVAARATAP